MTEREELRRNIQRYISLREGAERCNLSMSTWKRLIKAGQGPLLTKLSARRWGSKYPPAKPGALFE